MTPRVGAPLAALALMAIVLPTGGRWFAAAVVIVAAAALLVFAAAMAANGPRPVLAAAAVAGVGTPLRLLFEPQARLAAIPALAAGMLLTAFVLTIASGRRTQITTALGATFFCGLLVGAGAGGLVVLRLTEYGFRWALGLVVLTIVPEAIGLAAERLRPREPAAANGARAVAMAAGALALLMAANPPFTPVVAAGVLLVCVAAAFAAAAFQRSLPNVGWQQPLLRPFGSLLLAAPAVYFLATVVQN